MLTVNCRNPILTDESSNIFNTRRITMTARIIDPETSNPSTVFLRNIDYKDGSGEGFGEAFFNEASQWSIPFWKSSGFCSDGASVMTSRDKGIRGRLKEHKPHLIYVHCMVHRLACTFLCWNTIWRIKTSFILLLQTFSYIRTTATQITTVT